MTSTTNIAWTQRTWNPVVGCTRVSEGCDHCYAVAQSPPIANCGNLDYRDLTVLNAYGTRHFNGTIRCLPERLSDPLKRKKPTMYFVNSMSDLFHPGVPSEFQRNVFITIERCRQHTFQVLTKRPEAMRDRMKHYYDRGDGLPRGFTPISNLWLGVSCENQQRFDERCPALLDTPAAVRFLSLEPLLGPIDLADSLDDETYGANGGDGPCPYIHWIIVGGESGPGFRPMNIDWLEAIVIQCRKANVPVFVKQDSGHRPGRQGRVPKELWIQEFPK